MMGVVFAGAVMTFVVMLKVVIAGHRELEKAPTHWRWRSCLWL